MKARDLLRSILGLVALACVAGVAVADDDGDRDAWKSAGGNIHDTHTAGASRSLEPANVPALAAKWTLTAAGNLHGSPAVRGDGLYVVDWGGKFHKVDRRNGITLWSRSVSEYTGNPASFSRGSPAVSGHTVVIGDQVSATIIAVESDTGALLWKTVLDPHPLA